MAGKEATLSALRGLSRKPEFEGSELSDHVEDYRSGEDRTVCVIAGAAIESTIRQLLLSKFIALTNKEYGELFMGTGPLSTFSAKIKMAYAMGLIGNSSRHNAEVIKEIRNAFSHTQHHIGFDTAEVAAACGLLISHERDFIIHRNLARHQFISAVLDTGFALWGSKPLPVLSRPAKSSPQKQPTPSRNINRRRRERRSRQRPPQSSPE